MSARRTSETEEDLARLQQRLERLQKENRRLRRSLALASHDRDAYLKALYGFLKREVTAEDLREFEREILEGSWSPADDLLQRVDTVRGKGAAP
jgi:hypothetical protein